MTYHALAMSMCVRTERSVSDSATLTQLCGWHTTWCTWGVVNRGAEIGLVHYTVKCWCSGPL